VNIFSKKYVFASICSTPAICFPELKLHPTVKPRAWWEAKFAKYNVKKVYQGQELEYIYRVVK